MRNLRALTVIAALVLVGCPQRTAVWIEPGSTAAHLTFRMAEKRGGHKAVSVGVFRVDQCTSPSDARTVPMWGAGTTASATSSALSRIVYGDMPNGYEPLIHQGDSALALAPGCYRATISGTGEVVFDVTNDGQVVEH